MTIPAKIDSYPKSAPSVEESLSLLEERLSEQVDKFVEITRVGALVTSLLELEQILPSVMESALAIVKGEVGQMVLFDAGANLQSDICWGL